MINTCARAHTHTHKKELVAIRINASKLEHYRHVAWNSRWRREAHSRGQTIETLLLLVVALLYSNFASSALEGKFLDFVLGIGIDGKVKSEWIHKANRNGSRDDRREAQRWT